MNKKFIIPLGFLGLAAGSASAQGLYLYDANTDAKESIPLKWVVGANAIYDTNPNPGYGTAKSSFALNPSVGLSFVSMTPQTTWDVYARLGLIYYFNPPTGTNDLNSQSRVGINLTHRFNERLRFSSRNFISYELEPDYTYGYASSRQQGEYLFWQSDDSIGYRWTERFATYTGLLFTGTTYQKVQNNDFFTWQAYNQFRYQLYPQTVLTFDARYGQSTASNGVASDYTDQYYLVGVEHRFSPTTIGIVHAGAQLHDVADGTNSSSPFVEFVVNSQVNQQLMLRSYARFGIEGNNTVQFDPHAFPPREIIFDKNQTLRFGLSGEYAISPKLSLFSGLDYLPTSYSSGRYVTGTGTPPDMKDSIINAYIGASLKFNDYLTGSLSYNYTHSTSDTPNQTYNRSRISLGLSSEF